MKSVIITVCAVLLLAACGQEAEKSAPSADAEKTEPLAEVAKKSEKAETTKPEPAEKPEPIADAAKETEMAETTAPEPAEKPEPVAEVAKETEEAASEAATPETVVEEVDETVVVETAPPAVEATEETVVEKTTPEATAEAEETVAEEAAPAATETVEEAAVEETSVERTPSPPGAKVFFIMPQDGATVRNPIALQFGVEGMDIAPAGDDDVNSGHHHLLIDGKLEDYNAPIPTDDNNKHYGGAQTETAIGLEPGEHTLQLILGDHNHIPHDPPVESDVITITVE